MITRLEPYLTDSSQSNYAADLLYKKCKSDPVSFQIADRSKLEASCLSIKKGFTDSIAKLNASINKCKTTTKTPGATTKTPGATTKRPATSKHPTPRTGGNFTTLTHYMKYGDDVPILQEAASNDSKRYWMGFTENIKPNMDPRFNNFARI
jgi:hypothetical protein